MADNKLEGGGSVEDKRKKPNLSFLQQKAALPSVNLKACNDDPRAIADNKRFENYAIIDVCPPALILDRVTSVIEEQPTFFVPWARMLQALAQKHIHLFKLSRLLNIPFKTLLDLTRSEHGSLTFSQGQQLLAFYTQHMQLTTQGERPC